MMAAHMTPAMLIELAFGTHRRANELHEGAVTDGWKWVAALVLAIGGTAAFAQVPTSQRGRPGRPVSFLACPEFRDTARQCWVAESYGKIYYIGGFGIATPPQLLHRVLVEGVAHDDEMSCGAINIDPIHISPLPEIDASCDTVLPDNGTAPREGSIFDLPAAALARNGAGVLAPPPLHGNTTFIVVFDFDRAILNLVNQANVEMIARAVMNSQVERVIITGHAGRSRLSNGSTMVETSKIAALRTAAVSDALIRIGVNPSIVDRREVDKTAIDAAVGDVESRNATVEIQLAKRPASR
jgi:outer membrane protein OmpA-like peptidoglycan-associated protein